MSDPEIRRFRTRRRADVIETNLLTSVGKGAERRNKTQQANDASLGDKRDNFDGQSERKTPPLIKMEDASKDLSFLITQNGKL